MTTSAKPNENVACQCGCGFPVVPQRGRAWRFAPLLSATLILLMPKCPLCFFAWFGILGSFKASSVLTTFWGTPLVAVLLSIPLACLSYRANARNDWRPFGMGLVGSALVIISKTDIGVPFAIYAGISMLVGALIWSGHTMPRQVAIIKCDNI